MRSFLVVLIISIIAIPRLASADIAPPPGEIFKKSLPVDLTADSVNFDNASQTYYAKGNVVIVQDKMTLKADEVVINMSSGVAHAFGAVELTDDLKNVLKGEDISMNINEKTLVIARARIFYQPEKIRLTADYLSKTTEKDYEGTGITYTSCEYTEPEDPAWDFYISNVSITYGDYLTGRNVFFRIKGVPVLYAPYMTIPIRRARQTGLLQPIPAYSVQRGFVYKQALFWAISQNTDATYYLDFESRRGIGSAAEFRYIRSRKSGGEIFFSHFQENDLSRIRGFRNEAGVLVRPETAKSGRWFLKYVHNEEFENGVQIRANINLVSDDEYFVDFGKPGYERSLESLESNVSISKNWRTYSLTAQFRYFNNLVSAKDMDTLQLLPSFNLNGLNEPIFGGPFYISSEHSLVNFYRREGLRGTRLDMHPRLSMPVKLGGVLDVTPWAAPRVTLYNVDNNPERRYVDRSLYDSGVEVSTTFVDVFYNDDITKRALRHSIRPKFVYTYIPDVPQREVPKFDAIDEIKPVNSVALMLNNALTGRYLDNGKTKYTDYVFLDIGTSYDIMEATRPRLNSIDKRRPFANILGDLRINPAQWASVVAKGTYDAYRNWFVNYDTSLRLSGPSVGDLFASHRFTRDGASYLEGGARLHVTNYFDLTYLQRYSITAKTALETAYAMEYNHQCWNTILTFSMKPEENIVMLTFNLLGLGKIAGISAPVGGI